jgi:hypothetical protein
MPINCQLAARTLSVSAGVADVWHLLGSFVHAVAAIEGYGRVARRHT